MQCDEAAGAMNTALKRLRDVPRLLDRLRAVAAVTPKKEWRACMDSVVALLQLQEARAAMRGMPDCSGGVSAAGLLLRCCVRYDTTR